MKLPRLTLALLCCMLLLGCSRDTGVLTGSVSFEGKPLPNGMVAARRMDDDRIANGNIENGVYRIPNAPLGKVQLMVQSLPPPTSAAPPNAKGEPVAPITFPTIPERYNDFATSKLFTTVNPGENKLDLPLEK